MGGAGMFAVSVYMVFMGGYYDKLVAAKLPAGADVAAYNAAPAGSDMANTLNNAKSLAGPHIINTTLIIPLILIAAFAILFIYMRSRNTKPLSVASTAIVIHTTINNEYKKNSNKKFNCRLCCNPCIKILQEKCIHKIKINA